MANTQVRRPSRNGSSATRVAAPDAIHVPMAIARWPPKAEAKLVAFKRKDDRFKIC